MNIRPKKSSVIDLSLYGMLYILSGTVVVAAFYQQFLQYSPIPAWDMQKGYMGFLNQIAEHHWSSLFSPYNEHRIIWQRILFYIDNKYFFSNNIFLVVLNGVLITCNVVILSLIGLRGNQFVKFLPLALAWCFLLCQGENITSAFQAQFHLAYLIPLVGLYLLMLWYQSISKVKFIIVSSIGLSAIGTMANGIVTIPIYFLLSFLLKMPRWVSLSFIFISVVEFATMRFLASAAGDKLLPNLVNDPYLCVQFFFMLLGSPFYYLFEGLRQHWISVLFGVLFLTSVTVRIIGILRSDNPSPRACALVAFCLYVVVGYFGAAISRANADLDSAIAWRYTTPAILGWTAVALLYADWISIQIENRVKRVGLVAIMGAITLYQVVNIGYFSQVLFERKIAFLGVALGINDQDGQKTLGDPRLFREVLEYSGPAYDKNIGYFQNYPYSHIRDQIDKDIPLSLLESVPECVIDDLKNISITDPGYIKFLTTIHIPNTATRFPDFVRLYDESGKQFGFGFVRSNWVDRREMKSVNGKYELDVEGYYKGSTPLKIFVNAEQAGSSFCRAAVGSVRQVVSISTPALNDQNITLSLDNIENLSNINGSDYDHSDLCKIGLRVLGTYGSGGDADKGDIAIMMRPNDSFFFKSGPTGGNQTLSISGKQDMLLPVSGKRWLRLSLASSLFSDGKNMRVTLRDNGVKWGEWFAIAVKSNGNRC